MQPIKKVAITLVGSLLLLLGVIMIVLPGPAVLVIPIALAILSLEYPMAKVWLKKSQRLLSKSAQQLDRACRR